jgi:dihydrofolate reductase
MSCHTEEDANPVPTEETNNNNTINTRVTIIAACSEHGGIARKKAVHVVTPAGVTVWETMPWRYTQVGDIDMRFFRQKTLDSTVIVGINTYETFGGRPLPKRINIVLSRSFENQTVNPIGGQTALIKMNNYEAAVESAKGTKTFVIGGAEIYSKAIDSGCDSVLLNVIPGMEYDDACDLKFPLEKLLNNYMLVECKRLWDMNEEHLKETASVVSTRWTRLPSKGIPVPTKLVPLDTFTVIEWGQIMSIVNVYNNPALRAPEVSITKFMSGESAMRATGFGLAFIGALIESKNRDRNISHIRANVRTHHDTKAIEAHIDKWSPVLKIAVNGGDSQSVEEPPKRIEVTCEETPDNSAMATTEVGYRFCTIL